MKKLMLKSLLIGLPIGLLLTLAVAFYAVRTLSEEYLPRNGRITEGLCSGVNLPQQQEKTVQQKIGIPFGLKTTSVQNIDSCTADPAYQIKKTPAFKSYAKSWQFYVNWFIWSAPFVLLSYVFYHRAQRLRLNKQIEKSL